MSGATDNKYSFSDGSIPRASGIRIGQLRTQTSNLADRAWIFTVGSIDGVLRRYYHVYEYSQATDCVFRIALNRARHSALLADGTVVQAGEVIGALHLWNEHLLRFPSSGPDLHWAKAMHLRVRHSLQALCRHVEDDPAWAGVQAIRAEVPLPVRLLAGEQMRRVARHHGFEIGVRDEASGWGFSLLAENLLLWGFARAYNPHALSHGRLLRRRQELWLSRVSLVANYAHESARGNEQAALRVAA